MSPCSFPKQKLLKTFLGLADFNFIFKAQNPLSAGYFLLADSLDQPSLTLQSYSPAYLYHLLCQRLHWFYYPFYCEGYCSFFHPCRFNHPSLSLHHYSYLHLHLHSPHGTRLKDYLDHESFIRSSHRSL